MRGRNGSSPNIEVDDEEDSARQRMRERLDEQAEEQGKLFAAVSRLDRKVDALSERVSKLRSKTWTAKEWATLIAALAAAAGVISQMFHLTGK